MPGLSYLHCNLMVTGTKYSIRIVFSFLFIFENGKHNIIMKENKIAYMGLHPLCFVNVSRLFKKPYILYVKIMILETKGRIHR